MTKNEERYFNNVLNSIRAALSGVIIGAYMFPIPRGYEAELGSRAGHVSDKVMEMLESDIRKLYKYAQRNAKPKK